VLSGFSGSFRDDITDAFNESGDALVGQDATLYCRLRQWPKN